MRLERHHFLVGIAIASLFMAIGGSIHAVAQSAATAPGATRGVIHRQLEAGLAWRHLEYRDAAARARSALAGRGTVGGFRNPMAPTVNVGSDPTDVAVDQSNHTAYVSNANDNTVSVVNIAHCRARNTSGCDQVAPVVAVGATPVADVFDAQEHTVYVTDTGDNTVSMINTAACNAAIVSGCNHVLKLVVGANPDFAVVDPATHTLYVVDAGANAVSVINAATCNATTTSGCGAMLTVTVGTGPTAAAVDDAAHTVYVATGLGVSGPGSVSMINATTCNAGTTSGCMKTPRTAAAGVNASWVALDPSTHTVYVAGGPTGGPTSLGFVDVIDDATCNATVTVGCRPKPLAVTVGSIPIGVVVDPLTGSVFVANEEDSTVSVIDGSICNAGITSGCHQHPPNVAVGFNAGTPAVDLSTDTVYVPNQDENSVSVLDGAACTLTHESGCRHAAPTTTVGAGPSGVATDQATNTVYVTSQNDNNMSVVNGAICNAEVRSGCGQTWPTVATGSVPQAVAVNQVTDTVYVANKNDNTVSVIDGATCNATNHFGCGQAPATITVGSGPLDLTVNEMTDTVYVANQIGNTVSVIDGATCNATNHSGCNQIPPVVSVGKAPVSIAVDQRTDTVYVADWGGGSGNTVSVINGATCNSSTHAGCGQTPATVVVGSAPGAIAVDEITDTIYVANGWFAYTPTTSVSVIDGATCNAGITTGCGQTPATMMMGGNPFAIAVDQNTDTVYAGSIIDSIVYVFNGAACNATVTSGCSQIPRSVPTGGWPGGVAVNTATHTVYVADNVDGEASFFRAR